MRTYNFRIYSIDRSLYYILTLFGFEEAVFDRSLAEADS